MDVKLAKSIPVNKAAEALACMIEDIRDLVRRGEAEMSLLITDSFQGERRKVRHNGEFFNRTVEDICPGLEGPLLFVVSDSDIDRAVTGDGIGLLLGHWKDGQDFIDYTFRPAMMIKLPLSSPHWRVKIDHMESIRASLKIERECLPGCGQRRLSLQDGSFNLQQGSFSSPVNKKGRSNGNYLTEAVKSLYDHFLNKGNTEILLPGKVSEFITRLRDSIKEGNPNFSDYVAERIKEVKKDNGNWVIRTHEKKESGEMYRKSSCYTRTRVSQILGALRKKEPPM